MMSAQNVVVMIFDIMLRRHHVADTVVPQETSQAGSLDAASVLESPKMQEELVCRTPRSPLGDYILVCPEVAVLSTLSQASYVLSTLSQAYDDGLSHMTRSNFLFRRPWGSVPGLRDRKLLGRPRLHHQGMVFFCHLHQE